MESEAPIPSELDDAQVFPQHGSSVSLSDDNWIPFSGPMMMPFMKTVCIDFGVERRMLESNPVLILNGDEVDEQHLTLGKVIPENTFLGPACWEDVLAEGDYIAQVTINFQKESEPIVYQWAFTVLP